MGKDTWAFKGNGVVWDRWRGARLCKFSKDGYVLLSGEEGETIAGKLRKLGYTEVDPIEVTRNVVVEEEQKYKEKYEELLVKHIALEKAYSKLEKRFKDYTGVMDIYPEVDNKKEAVIKVMEEEYIFPNGIVLPKDYKNMNHFKLRSIVQKLKLDEFEQLTDLRAIKKEELINGITRFLSKRGLLN